MGRHRRSDAGRAATGRATGVNETHGFAVEGHDPLHSYPADRGAPGIAPYLNPEAYAEAVTRSDSYLFAPDDRREDFADTAVFADTAAFSDTAAFAADGYIPDDGPRRAGIHRRPKKKAATPVRTGLLGVSAAVAIGTVAVATGVLPGGDSYTLGGGAGDKVQTSDTPPNTETQQGGTSGSADDGGVTTTPAGGGSESPDSPAPTPSATKPEKEPTTEAPTEKPTQTTPSKKPKTPASPGKGATKSPAKTETPASPISAESAAEAEVLRLVNKERAKVGCDALAANSALAGLAGDFSNAMAAQNFFDHTDPSGATPWDRAEAAGITSLGGENIARGQADAQAVMDAWMDSPGHRANILNCDFKTLGVGVHYGSGGPWWTQNFGY
ncbi:CAP domain-containing protein [Streptomyces cadmiisoli]|uniref:CAP domain-containing protein n=1 Tax=Streptomyces cadmiisoli TaxID=2184053 RepID=UPI003665F1F5